MSLSRGTPVAFDERIQAVRPHAGQQASAARLRALLSGSAIRESHRDKAGDPRVQDAYSLRCMPQVHGAVRAALADRANHTRDLGGSAGTEAFTRAVIARLQ